MKALKEIITIGSGDVIGSVVSVIFWFYLAILVLPSEYGEIHYIISLATLLSTMTLLGTGNTFTVYLAKNKTVSSPLLLFSIIGGLIAVLISIILGNFIIGLLVFGIIIFVYGSTRDIAKRETKKYSLNIVIQKTLSVCFAFLGLQIAGIEGVIYGMAISYFFYIRYIFQDLKNHDWNISNLKNDFQEIKINSKFIFSNYFLVISDSFTKQSDKLLIAPIMGLTFLGNYSLTLQIISVFTIFPSIIFKFFLPNLISGNISKNLQRNTILLSFVFVFIGVAILPIVIPIYFENYTEIVTLIQIMSFSIIPLTISQFYFGRLLSQENGKIPLIGLLISSVIMLSGMIALGTIFGDIGIAITHVGTFSFLTGYYYFSFRTLNIQNKSGTDAAGEVISVGEDAKKGYLNAQLLEKINYTKSEAVFRCKNCHNFLNFEYFCETCEIQHMDNNGLLSYGNVESKNKVNEKKISEIISEINKKDYFNGIRHFLENNPQYQDRFMMNEGDVAFSKIKNFDRCLIINSDLGNISENLSKMFGQVYSIDTSKNKLLIQKFRLEANNFKNFFLIHLEKIDFPFPNNYFDLIIVNGKSVDDGIFDDEKNLDYFNKIKQILKPDGCLCVNTLNHRGIGLDNIQKYTDFNQGIFCKSHSDYLKLFRKLDFSTSSSWVFPSHNKPHYLGDLDDKISTKWYLQNFHIFHDIQTKLVFIKYFLKFFPIFGTKNILKFFAPSFIFYCYKDNENYKCLDDTIRKNSGFNHLIQFSRRDNVKFIMIDEFSEPQQIISCNRKTINFDEEITLVNRKLPHMKNPDKDIFSEKWFGNKTLDRFNQNELEMVLNWLINFQKITTSEFFDSNSINEEIANLKNELSKVEMMRDLPFELWLQQYREHISNIKMRKTAIHGDFQIKNIIIDKNDLSINVIDWGDFLEKGNPLIDFVQLLTNILLSDGMENFNKNLTQNSKISPSVKLIKKMINRHFDHEFDYKIMLRFIVMRLVTKRVNNTYMNYVSYVKLLKILSK